MKSKEINRKKDNILSEEDFKDVKVRVNMFVSEELLNLYRAEAKRMGIGYQTLMQIKLKESMNNPLEKRIESIEKRLKRA